MYDTVVKNLIEDDISFGSKIDEDILGLMSDDDNPKAGSDEPQSNETDSNSSVEGVIELNELLQRLGLPQEEEFTTNNNSGTYDSHSETIVASDRHASLWHNRIGHVGNIGDIQRMMREGILPPIRCGENKCEDCTKGKYKKRFKGSLTNAKTPGRIHADVKGLIKPLSYDQHGYFVTMVDSFSRYLSATPLKTKGDASREVLTFCEWFERQVGFSILELHTDGGGEFQKASAALRKLGVEISLTTPHTPSSNGLAERYNGIVLSLSRTCLLQAKIPLKYWPDAVRHVVDSNNMVPHSTTKEIPYEKLFGENHHTLNTSTIWMSSTLRAKQSQVRSFRATITRGDMSWTYKSWYLQGINT